MRNAIFPSTWQSARNLLNTACNKEISRHSVPARWQGWREFPSAPLMLKENRHCLNDSEQPFKHWKKGKRCLSGVFSVAVNAWRASPFAPNAWTISCEWQTTLDRVLTTWHEQKSVVTHFVCAGRFWYFLTRQKVHERKTTKWINDKSIKVKNYGGILWTQVCVFNGFSMLQRDALTMLAYRIPRGANYTSTTRDYYCKHCRTKLSSHTLCRHDMMRGSFGLQTLILKRGR